MSRGRECEHRGFALDCHTAHKRGVVCVDAKATGATPGRVLRRIESGDARMLAIDQVVRAEMERHKIPGVPVGIVDRGAFTARGFDVEHPVPVADETIFQSGSLGKTFRATAVMLLVEPMGPKANK